MGNFSAMTGTGSRGRLLDLCYTCNRVLLQPAMHLCINPTVSMCPALSRAPSTVMCQYNAGDERCLVALRPISPWPCLRKGTATHAEVQARICNLLRCAPPTKRSPVQPFLDRRCRAIRVASHT